MIRQTAELARSLRPAPTSNIRSSPTALHTLASTIPLAAAGIAYVVIPGAIAAAAAGTLDPGFAPVWVAGLVLGGILATVAVWLDRGQLEVVGLCLLGSSVLFAGVAVLDVRERTAVPTAFIYFSSALSCFARAWTVVYLARVRDRISRAVDERELERVGRT